MNPAFFGREIARSGESARLARSLISRAGLMGKSIDRMELVHDF
jgi:hypothetical protein